MRRAFARLLRSVYQGWIILGGTMIFIAVIEIILYPISKFDLLNKRPPEAFNLLDKAASVPPSYATAEWYSDYIEEFPKAVLHTDWSPYVYWRTSSFKGKYININENSTRRTWTSHSNNNQNSHSIKVFMFGGSTMWGWGVRDNFTIPSLVAKILYNEYNINADIINFGELGYVSTQEVIRLIKEIQRQNLPELVIFYDGVNDIFSALRPGQTGIAGVTYDEYEREQTFKNNSILKRMVNAYTSHSSLYYIICKLVNKDPLAKINQYTSSQFNQIAEDILMIYKENINIVKSLSKFYQFKALFYWQPMIFTKTNLTFHEQKLAQAGRVELVSEPVFRLVNNKITYMQDDVFHDISDILSSHNNTFYIDFCHLDEKANEIVARRIVKDIIKLSF